MPGTGYSGEITHTNMRVCAGAGGSVLGHVVVCLSHCGYSQMARQPSLPWGFHRKFGMLSCVVISHIC